MLNKEKIASTEIFKGLSQEELSEVAKLCEEVILNEGDRVFTEGERADYLFILEEGSVDLRFELPYRKTSREMTVTTIEPRECFSWSALVHPHKATLSCYSTGKAKAIKIRGVELLNLCDKNYHIGFIIMQNLTMMIGGRLTKQQEVFIKEAGDSLQFKW
ncbi:MAG: cyclic nucleotide-binding domain-containing protein [Syntrophobacterales bacterium]|nr:MAG: cyclic nucleotide-binding domain-containing protein [Syntrophobacterales bacterium]